MRKLLYGMNLSVDGYISAPGDDLGWSEPNDELFQWWLDEERAIELFLYGRKLWEMMSSYWPTGDQQPGANPAEIEFARNWRDTPKVVFSSTLDEVDWNARLFDGDAVAEISRKHFHMRDTYGIEVLGNVDPALVISVAVAVESLNE